MADQVYKLNATAASLLGFLHEKPMTGWNLAKVAEEQIGTFWNLTKSQVYRELQSMEAVGYVVGGERGERDRKIFSLTNAGRRAFAEWLQQMPGDEIIRFPLLLSVSFADYIDPELTRSFIVSHRSAHQGRLQQYKEGLRLVQEDNVKNIGLRATFSFGIRYEEMVLEWMDDTLNKLDGVGKVDEERELK